MRSLSNLVPSCLFFCPEVAESASFLNWLRKNFSNIAFFLNFSSLNVLHHRNGAWRNFGHRTFVVVKTLLYKPIKSPDMNIDANHVKSVTQKVVISVRSLFWQWTTWHGLWTTSSRGISMALARKMTGFTWDLMSYGIIFDQTIVQKKWANPCHILYRVVNFTGWLFFIQAYFTKNFMFLNL